MKIQDLMQKSGVASGTSGTRVLVTQMTDEVCAAYVAAFLIVIARSFNFERVALSMGLRPSSLAIAAACARRISHTKPQPLISIQNRQSLHIKSTSSEFTQLKT